jgi:hypothetical protein
MRPGPAHKRLTFSDARLAVDKPLPSRVGTVRLDFRAP